MRLKSSGKWVFPEFGVSLARGGAAARVTHKRPRSYYPSGSMEGFAYLPLRDNCDKNELYARKEDGVEAAKNSLHALTRLLPRIFSIYAMLKLKYDKHTFCASRRFKRRCCLATGIFTFFFVAFSLTLLQYVSIDERIRELYMSCFSVVIDTKNENFVGVAFSSQNNQAPASFHGTYVDNMACDIRLVDNTYNVDVKMGYAAGPVDIVVYNSWVSEQVNRPTISGNLSITGEHRQVHEVLEAIILGRFTFS